MATKNNIRSIRFSDELAELIERQQGSNFTQKFENLVTRCVWELPARERELEQLEARIQEKREQLRRMSAQARELSETLRELLPRAEALELTYLLVEVDGVVVMEIDKLNQVYNVNGVDMLADVRNMT